MSTMIFEVYDALKEAGASEEKARKANRKRTPTYFLTPSLPRAIFTP
jgi:hypothetical protein